MTGIRSIDAELSCGRLVARASRRDGKRVDQATVFVGPEELFPQVDQDELGAALRIRVPRGERGEIHDSPEIDGNANP